MTIAVRFQQVSKRYTSAMALQNVSFTIPAGSIFGLVGNSGAGKTTAIRILLGLTRQTSGTVTLFEDSFAPRVGFVPEQPALYGWMGAREYLTMSAALASVPEDARANRIDHLLMRAGLGNGQARISTFSIGEVQMLGIAHALIGNPDLLILDEPTSPLDAADTHRVLDLITSLRGQTTVLLSSHMFDDIEHVVDEIAIIDHGNIIATGSVDALRTQLDIPPRMVMVQPSLEDIILQLTEGAT